MFNRPISFEFHQIDEILRFRNNLNRRRISYDVNIVSYRIVFLPKKAAI